MHLIDQSFEILLGGFFPLQGHDVNTLMRSKHARIQGGLVSTWASLWYIAATLIGFVI